MNGAPSPNPSPEIPPDFRHIESWIFDLDNTLYRADCGIFAQIESRMTDYVARFTGLPRDEARQLQKSLYRSHGTTLNGLMRLHGAEPDAYLAFVHDIDLGSLNEDRALTEAVARLPGRRFVFTNGCRNHAGRILSKIGMAGLFDDIWDIRTIGFVPKPDAAAYETVVKLAGIDTARAAMFEDIPHNLLAAHTLGMTTVWLDSGIDFSSHGTTSDASHVDYRTNDLPQFLHSIRI